MEQVTFGVALGRLDLFLADAENERFVWPSNGLVDASALAALAGVRWERPSRAVVQGWEAQQRLVATIVEAIEECRGVREFDVAGEFPEGWLFPCAPDVLSFEDGPIWSVSGLQAGARGGDDGSLGGRALAWLLRRALAEEGGSTVLDDVPF